MESGPKDHHYLPQFYLKSFSFRSKKKSRLHKLYSYDKIYERRVTPKLTREICYEKHRNTLQIDGTKDLFIEKSFSELETIMAEFFRVTQEFSLEYDNEKKKKLKVWDREKFFRYPTVVPLKDLLSETYYYRLMNYFLSVFYWRLTVHDEYFEVNTTKSFLSESIKNLSSASKLDRDFGLNELEINLEEYMEFSFVLNEEHNFMKIFKSLIYPMDSIFKLNGNAKDFYKLYIPTISLVSSDFPFVTKSNGVALDREFIFTWSPDSVFLNIDKLKASKRINLHEFGFKISVLNYLQAKRYVFCKDEKMLKNVIWFANMRYGVNGVSALKSELFGCVE
ncbi:DUF4238 domain-containing protein [Vibrio genomosp. F6]|uniref:DUF4238 domain-containing protein n=1 Tax=Vibrio genomosp. F6 str. FF-238 TaxID=1191298 RepID=A0A1E5D076_9VIBR|nr:DUF4238 domain-containing protein [Vibrio genomosp. F6]OEE76696.1 hypothetical protein A130_15390 [Vibrio genomosp. F6 str. FF-238]